MIFQEQSMPDYLFFIILFIIIGIFIAVYLLTPIIKRKQFEEARANLRKREVTFRANLKRLSGEANVEENIDEEAV